MKDYQELINKFPNSFDTRNQIIEYLEKYWLEKTELVNTWVKIKSTIFKGNYTSYPDGLLNDNFNIMIIKGGPLFGRDDFEQLRRCMKVTGDIYFVLLEDYDEDNPPDNLPPSTGLINWPPLRFKFPADITFDEIMSGDFVSAEVFDCPVRDYFIFGDSGLWGIYAGDDFETPLQIIGFKKEYSGLFHRNIKISKEDIEDLKEWTASLGMKFPDATR